MDKLKKAGWVAVAGIFVIGGGLEVAKVLGCTPCGQFLQPLLSSLEQSASANGQ